MNVPLTMQQAINALGAINGLLGAPGVQLPRRFAYALARNQAILERIVRAHEKALKADAAYQVYEAARVALAKASAQVKDGKPVMRGNAYVIADIPEFNAALDALQDEHRPAVQALEDRMEESAEPDGRPVDVYAIPDVPAFVPAVAMAGLAPLLDEQSIMEGEEPAAMPGGAPVVPLAAVKK